MALFTLADLHLSLSVNKPMDIFGGNWTGYMERLKEYWEYMVQPQDTVVIPGDISWAMSLEEAYTDLSFLNRLPGEKVLMRGNHDYWWSSLTKMDAFAKMNCFSTLRFLQNDALYTQGKIICGSRGWMCEDKMTEQDEKVLRRESLRFRLSLEKAKLLAERETRADVAPEIIVFSHYPLLTAAQRENPILDVLKEYGIKRVYYGHLHNWNNKPLYDTWEDITMTLISSDYQNFTPVRIE